MKSRNQSAYTDPEMAAERARAKRLVLRMEARQRKAGTCCLCLHRDRESAPWGINHCRLKVERRYPACDRDGKEPKFQFDDKLLPEFADAA